MAWGLVWIISSVAVIWLAQQPWRQAPPPDSWRKAYWRGPEPNPNTMVIDYTRNDRLFRFEKYIKTVGPQSFDQVPALLEAMDYEDYRFYEPAAWAFVGLKSEAKKHADVAVPILARHLHPCTYNAKSLQTTISVLGLFGSEAKEAVPALIEQLRCDKTNTYEVTGDIIRWQAARVLGEIGPAAHEAIPALAVAMNDRSSGVREASRQSLSKIQRAQAPGTRKAGSLPNWISLPSK